MTYCSGTAPDAGLEFRHAGSYHYRVYRPRTRLRHRLRRQRTPVTVKHAGAEALRALGDLLSALRGRGLKERSPGIFYRGGKAWLHFHEDAAGLFADFRPGTEWQRFDVSTPKDWADLLVVIDRTLATEESRRLVHRP